jgi:ParB family chromosome partitioning protein
VQKVKRSGLPPYVGMRHDTHFVDLISTRPSGPRIRMLPLTSIDANPQQARSELGNLEDLMASIKARGVLEPILVRPKGSRFEIIAGERRYLASRNIGLKEIPCIEMKVRDNEALELALIENLQRKDLDAFEEADGLKALMDLYGFTHVQIAEKIGKARSTITEIIDLGKIPSAIRELCKQNNILSRSILIEISKQKNEEAMRSFVEEIIAKGLTRKDTRDLSKLFSGKTKKLKYYVFNFTPKASDGYRLRIEFKKQAATKEEIIQILEEIIKSLSSQEGKES